MAERDDPLFDGYYQKTADFLHIFWQYHNLRLTSGENPFTSRFITNPQARLSGAALIHEARAYGDTGAVTILRYYSGGIAFSMIKSLREFLPLIGEHPGSLVRFNSPSPPQEILDRYKDFAATNYPKSLFKIVRILHKTISEFSGHQDTQDMLASAFLNAAQVIVQMNALAQVMPPRYQPELGSYAIAKVDARQLDEARSGIGLDKDGYLRGHFFLVDPTSPSGLDAEELRFLGAGKALGCAAARPASDKCKEYLAKHCGALDTSGDVVRKLAARTKIHFKEDVLDWVGSLTNLEAQSLIDPKELGIMRGEMPNAIQIRYPYPRPD